MARESEEGSIEQNAMDVAAEDYAMNPDGDKAVSDVKSDVDNHPRLQQGDGISTGGVDSVEYVIRIWSMMLSRALWLTVTAISPMRSM